MLIRWKMLTQVFFVLCLFLTACQTITAQKSDYISLRKLLAKKNVIALPYKKIASGLIYISVSTDFGEKMFLFDTGATRSAVFKGSNEQLIRQSTHIGSANVFGLVTTSEHPLIEVSKIEIGETRLRDVTMAVLPVRKDDFGAGRPMPDGIIGMDIIGSYNVFVNNKNRTLYLFPANYHKPQIVTGWTPITLFHNPHAVVDKNLHFFNVRVGDHLMPAIFDTGAEFSIVNWNASKIPTLRRLRRSLRESWEIQGAVGKFDPTAQVDVQRLRAGRMIWDNRKLVVMNFDHLDNIGFKDEPLVVAGIDLFQDKSVYLDFQENRLWIEQDTGLQPTSIPTQ